MAALDGGRLNMGACSSGGVLKMIGGDGCPAERGLEQIVVDLSVDQILEGMNEIVRLIGARKLPVRVAADNLTPPWKRRRAGEAAFAFAAASRMVTAPLSPSIAIRAPSGIIRVASVIETTLGIPRSRDTLTE